MGCGGSKSTGVGGGRATGARNDNPPIESIDVPDTNPKYPAPKPPPNSKDDFYRPGDYASIETRIKQQNLRINATTYDTLIKALTTGCTTDLQKVRAIFVWLFLQDVHGSFYSGVKDPYTPRGYMKLIKTGDGSYASFFAQLCRSADIPCNVIRGVAKGDNYQVGQLDMTGLESAWNAVYVDGSWRLIHPLWSYFQEKQTYSKGLRPPAGTKRSSIHEFYWLIDPNKMICFCKPTQDSWQLLKTKWEHSKFLKSPQFTEDYFTCGLMLPKKYNAIIYSDNGLCIIDMDHHDYEEPKVDAKVIFDQNMSGDTWPENTDMKDYMAKANSSTRKTIVIRFPARGRYNADIFGGKDSRMPKIVEFRLEVEDIKRNPQPFPLNPAEGFGVLPVASTFGISDPVPDSGIIPVKPAQPKHISFTCTQKLEVEAIMFHSTTSSDNLSDFISTKTTDTEVHVIVAVPDEPNLEFGLQIGVRPTNASRSFTTVANYLLVDENWKKKTAVVSPTKSVSKTDAERIRKALIAATHKTDIARLEQAIEDFEHNHLPDNGDLTRARHKLVQLHLQNLRKKTLERKLDDLDQAIAAAKKSHVAVDLVDTKEMADAEATQRQLRRLKLNMHRVLALRKSTISEIHSYQRPKPLVHSVMKATFRILGEPRPKLQDWTYIQNNMRTLGRNNMIARMKRCDVVHMKKVQVNDAEKYLSETNKYLVRMCSAGAGTFFVWSNNMISEYHGKGEVEHLKIWGVENKWDKKNNSSRKSNPNDSSYQSNPYGTPRDQDKTKDSSKDRAESFQDHWKPNDSSTARNDTEKKDDDDRKYDRKEDRHDDRKEDRKDDRNNDRNRKDSNDRNDDKKNRSGDRNRDQRDRNGDRNDDRNDKRGDRNDDRSQGRRGRNDDRYDDRNDYRRDRSGDRNNDRRDRSFDRNDDRSDRNGDRKNDQKNRNNDRYNDQNNDRKDRNDGNGNRNLDRKNSRKDRNGDRNNDRNDRNNDRYDNRKDVRNGRNDRNSRLHSRNDRDDDYRDDNYYSRNQTPISDDWDPNAGFHKGRK